MKKRISLIIAIILVAALCAGCAAGNSAAGDRGDFDNKYSNDEQMEMESTTDSTTGFNDVADDALTDQMNGGGFVGSSSSQKQTSLAEKIIYSASAHIETVKFDDSVERIYTMVERYGGFLESSYVSGVDYDAEFYGYQTYRTANFVIRVPSEAFQDFESALASIGNVTYLSTEARNITTEYYDVNSRLTAYKTQEQTLLAMMEKAETVSEMIEIESALSEVRYNIEALTTTLKNWDNEVDYSTVMVDINEVKELTKQVPVQRTYWEELSDGFVSSLESIGRFFKELFAWFISNLPVIVIVAIFIAVGLIILKKIFARQINERRELKALRNEIKHGRKTENSENKENDTDNS